ncbi:MAG: cytochrome c [Capnocytophaga sp.]|nr:cytochrome c [Capnocytophaga sp.]
MKLITRTLAIATIALLVSCKGNNNQSQDDFSKPVKTEAAMPADPKESKGVGPIKELKLPGTIDETLAAAGKEAFDLKCTACHKIGRKFVGPDLTGVMERRSPEWVMNMILNPEEMVIKDPVAKQLLLDYNGSPMANQHLTEEETRSIVEYFRTLKN